MQLNLVQAIALWILKVSVYEFYNIVYALELINVYILVRLSPSGLPNVEMPICSSPYTRAGSVIIEVVDHGAGISKDQQSLLFQEGVQLNPKQLQSGQGEISTHM
jgi:signal transduction histidine kinase